MSRAGVRALPPPPGLEADPDGARIVAEELRLLSVVTDAIDTAAAHERAPKSAEDSRLLELREDVASAKPEDLPALFEQMHHIGALRAHRGKSPTGMLDRASPYFGHLRLEEAGKRRDVLIGSRSYLDPRAGIRVVDWRHAPVSRIYYRYAEEDDYEEELGDRTVEGCVLVRRGVTIRNGELVRVSSPQGTFARSSDGTWVRIENRRAKLSAKRGEPRAAKLGVDTDGRVRQDKHLPAIASLIDPKQFELITRPSSGLVVVQGSAGSGKTTVGLHRIAYLAFEDPKRFRPDRMLIVLPHEALVHYVDRVLPSLGVEGVMVSTFGRFALRAVGALFPKLPTHINDHTPPVVCKAKAHPGMLRAIDRAVAKLEATCDDKIEHTMPKWPRGVEVVRAWRALGHENVPPDLRLHLLSAWASGKRPIKGIPDSTLPEATRVAVGNVVAGLREHTRSVTGLWDSVITSLESLHETFDGVSDMGSARLEQVRDWCVRQARIRSEKERDGDTPTLDAEDLALLLRCWQKLRGPIVDLENVPIRYSHVFIDEVQAASPVELRVLLDLATSDRSITLAGDVAQRMLDDDDDSGEFDWDRLLTDLDVPHTKVEPLRVSYRSTAEITAFAREVLGPLAHEAEPIASRHGPPVELFQFPTPGEAVAWLAEVLRDLARDAPDANVALLSRYAPQADVYFEGLDRADIPNIRRIAALDFSWDPGVDITDVKQTRGLEFDEVILIDTNASSYPLRDAARHALYVGATRASHQLWCVATEEPSPVITTALKRLDLAEADATASSA